MHLAPAGKMGSCNCGMDSSVWLTWSAGASQKVAQAHSSDSRRRGVDFRRSESRLLVALLFRAEWFAVPLQRAAVRLPVQHQRFPGFPLCGYHFAVGIEALLHGVRLPGVIFHAQPVELVLGD